MERYQEAVAKPIQELSWKRASAWNKEGDGEDAEKQ